MSTSGLSGSWMYRSFNPTYVTGDQTPQEELDLILAGRMSDVDLNLKTSPDPMVMGPCCRGGVDGAIEWPGGGLNLMGTVEGVGGQGIFDMLRFDILGTGRPGTDTAGWEYGYQGHLTWPWTNAGDQLPTLVGSVIRAKPHEDSRAGSVYSFIAVKRQPNWASGLTGSWTYRSFHNKTTYVYPTAPPTTRKLILQEAVFKLETPTDTTLQGTIEWPGGVLGIDLTAAEVRPAEVPAEFTFRGIGRPGTSTAGWEYAYHGLLTRHWPTPPLSSWLSHVMSTPNEIDQRPALVGSVFRIKAHGDAPAGSVYPFIAVKQ